MKMKNVVFAAALALALCRPAVSEAAGAVSGGMLAELSASGGRIENVCASGVAFDPVLAPDTEFARAACATWRNADAPKFSSENLFLVRKSELGGEASLAAVSKIVRSISTMKGIQYYSNGDGKWETLYHKAGVIRSPDKRKFLPDDTRGSADGKSLFCLLEDNSFGDCVYRVDYRESADEVAAFFTSAAPFKYGPITAVKAGNLNINLVVTDIGDSLLVYMVVRAEYPSLPFLSGRMTRSFNARVEAMFKWFRESF